MKNTIAAQDWEFYYDPSRSDMNLKEKLMRRLKPGRASNFLSTRIYTIVKK